LVAVLEGIEPMYKPWVAIFKGSSDAVAALYEPVHSSVKISRSLFLPSTA